MKKTIPVQLMIVTIEDAIHRVSTSCMPEFFGNWYYIYWVFLLFSSGFIASPGLPVFI